MGAGWSAVWKGEVEVSKPAPSNVLPFPDRRRRRRPNLMGRVVGLIGEARYRDPATAAWKRVTPGLPLKRGAELITGKNARCALSLATGDVLQMTGSSYCHLVGVGFDRDTCQIRLAGRFGGLTLFPGGDTARPFRMDPLHLPAATGQGAPDDDDQPPSIWRVTDRCTDIIISDEGIEMRAVTRFEAGPH